VDKTFRPSARGKDGSNETFGSFGIYPNEFLFGEGLHDAGDVNHDVNFFKESRGGRALGQCALHPTDRKGT
jgi:hypothetical protein